MNVNNTTDFHWRNVLKPTPPNVFWFITTLEALVLAFNLKEINQDAPPWVPTVLLILQTVMGKVVLFFGRIKDEYEKTTKVTVESTGEVTVTEETIDNTAGGGE